MTKTELFKAVRDARKVLTQEERDTYSEDYDFGVADALEVVLRHLGLLNEYEQWEGDDV